MTPTIPARINQLAQSGLGLSAQDIASIVGVDAVEVLAYMRDNSHDIAAPGGGGAAIKSAVLFGASVDVPGDGNPAPWGAITEDTIGGVVVASEMPFILLPKGYYSGIVTFKATVAGSVFDTLSGTDKAHLTASLSGGGVHANAPIPSGEMKYGADFYGLMSDFSTPGPVISIPFAMESGDEDISALGLTEHGYVYLLMIVQIYDLTHSSVVANPLTLHDFGVYFQKLGDKA